MEEAESAGYTAGLRSALATLGWLPEEDRVSSASRQHHIDTGRYLYKGEASRHR